MPRCGSFTWSIAIAKSWRSPNVPCWGFAPPDEDAQLSCQSRNASRVTESPLPRRRQERLRRRRDSPEGSHPGRPGVYRRSALSSFRALRSREPRSLSLSPCAVRASSDSNGDAFSLDGLDDRLRAERPLLQSAARGHEGRNHAVLVESDFPGDFVDPAAEGRGQLGDDEIDVEVRFGRGLATYPRAEHSKILDLHTLREALPELPGDLAVLRGQSRLDRHDPHCTGSPFPGPPGPAQGSTLDLLR